MAVALDNSVKEAAKDNVSTLTTPAFTIGTGNTYCLALLYSGAGSPVVATEAKVGGSGGTAMTKLITELTFGGGFGVASVWALKSPPSGSQTIYGNWGTNQDERLIIAATFTGVDQTTPTGTNASGMNSTTTPSINVTAAVGQLVAAFLAVMDDATDAKTISATQTTIQEIEGTEGGKLDGYEIAGASYIASAVANPQAMAWAITGVALGDTNWAAMFGIPLNAAAAGGAARQNAMTMMGMG